VLDRLAALIAIATTLLLVVPLTQGLILVPLKLLTIECLAYVWRLRSNLNPRHLLDAP